MSISDVLSTINRMQADGVIDRYAVGGAIAATFYLEPVSTLDIDIFVAMQPLPGSLLLSLTGIIEYLVAHGCTVEGEYVMIAGWPVQFLPTTGPLVDEALDLAVETEVDGVPTRVFSAEHLAAITLETGRAKDKARLLQFLESGALRADHFQDILQRHDLTTRWEEFRQQYMDDAP